MEKVNLQSYLTHGRSRAGVFQVTKLSGATGVKRKPQHAFLQICSYQRVYKQQMKNENENC